MNEILLYKTDNAEVKVEILLQNENLWLTQAKMADLFDVQKAAISKHLKNIFAEGELQESSVVSKMETTAADGKNYNTNIYISSVSRSTSTTRPRQRSTRPRRSTSQGQRVFTPSSLSSTSIRSWRSTVRSWRILKRERLTPRRLSSTCSRPLSSTPKRQNHCSER